MKKIISLLLAFLTLSAVFAGCADKDKKPDGNTTETQNGGSDTVNEYDPGLPDGFQCEGYEFVILNSNQNEIAGILNDIYVEYSTELDSVSEAMYKRNAYVQDTYGCTISETVDSSGVIVTKVSDSFYSGTDDYSLVNVVGNLIYTMANDGLLYNLNQLDHVDLSKKWWTQGSIEGYSMAGLLYYASSDLTICDDEGTAIIMYNKTVAEDHKLETPDEMYDLVAAGGWTWDKMFAQAKQVGTGGDNGDSLLSDGDKFGMIVMDWSYIGMMISSGERFSVKDEDDILKINFNSASFVDVLDTLVQYTKQKRTYLCPTYDGKFSEDAFRNDNALMIMQVTAHVRNSRDMESDFAVLPMPKYSEAQDHYYSYCPRVTYVGVPSTILETEYVGGILEALTAKSSEIVIPEYLNIALSERFMRDEGSKRMVEYIFGHTVYDPLVSTLCWDTVFGAFTSMVKSRSNMVVNIYNKYGSYIEAQIEKAAECYRDLAEKTNP